MLIVQGKVCYLLGPRGTELYSEFKSIWLDICFAHLHSRNNIFYKSQVKDNIYVYRNICIF